MTRDSLLFQPCETFTVLRGEVARHKRNGRANGALSYNQAMRAGMIQLFLGTVIKTTTAPRCSTSLCATFIRQINPADSYQCIRASEGHARKNRIITTNPVIGRACSGRVAEGSENIIH
jgi:hypothetical protein